MDEMLNSAALLTMVGATAAATAVTQAVKMVWVDAGAAVWRGIALGTGVTVVLASYLTTQDVTVVGVVGGAVLGLQAGAAAVAGYDGVRSGFKASVEKAPPSE